MVQDTGASKPSYNAEFMARLYHEIDNVFSAKVEGANFLLEIDRMMNRVERNVNRMGDAEMRVDQ